MAGPAQAACAAGAILLAKPLGLCPDHPARPGRPKAAVVRKTVFSKACGIVGRAAFPSFRSLHRAMIRMLADGAVRPGGLPVGTGTADGA